MAGGDKVPRKGGPGVTRSDLLVINKTDLAPLVGADLSVMARGRGRGPRRAAGAVHLAGDRSRRFPEVAAWVRSVRAARGVIARTTAVIEPGGVLGALRCAPPLTLRQVRRSGPVRAAAGRDGGGAAGR